MLSKSKLLQWVEDKIDVNSGPYSGSKDEASCIGRINILNLLEMDIRAGRFDPEEVPHET